MKTVKTLVVLFAILLPLSANAIDCSAPDKFAKSVSDDVIKIIEKEKSDAAKTKKLEGIFSQIIDTQWMGRFALGKHFRDLTPAQQSEFSKAYRDYLVSSYIPSFKKYNGEKFEISGTSSAGADQIIMTKIQRSAGEPILINYRLTNKDGCYKVRDIIAEGVSLISTQRQDFDSVVTNKGFDELVKLLKSKDSTQEISTK